MAKSAKSIALQEEIGILISTIGRMERTRFDQCVRDLGLTRAQWRTLNAIKYSEGLNQAQLATRLEIEHITVTRSVDILVSLGWVERRPDPNDRRSRQLFLTAAAQPILDEVQELSALVCEEAYAGIPAAELKQLKQTLQKIRGNLVATLAREPSDELAEDSED